MEQTRISPISTPRMNWRHDLPIIAGLFLLTLALYWRVGHFDFINFDDPMYVQPPSRVPEGITLHSLWWALTTFHFNWHPLTWISLMLDFSLFGGSPRAIHLHSAVLHAINGVLLYVVLRNMTQQTWPAALAAGLFAMHPLRVEAVAWVSARKDVLSSMFWLLTMLAYGAYVRRRQSQRPGGWFYLLTVIAMAMGLMSKGMLVSMPLALLLLDCWPLRRCDLYALVRLDRNARRQFARLIIEKIPLFLLAIAGAWVNVVAQSAVGAISIGQVPLGERVGNAIISYAKYLRMTVAPYGLAFFYPHPAGVHGGGISGLHVAAALAILLLFTFLGLIASHRWPWLLVGWGWYIITLVPVIGIVQIGAQALADRYTYIPSIGLCIAVAWSIEAMRESARRVGRAIAILAVLALAALSWRQIGYWRDTPTVMARAIAVTDDNLVAHSNLAAFYDARGDADQATQEYQTVLSINQNDPVALSYLAARAAALNDIAKATRLYERSIESNPPSASAYNNYGNFLTQMGRSNEAIRALRTAISLDPEMYSAFHNLALVLARSGNVPAAIPAWQRAIQLNPDYVQAHFGLAQALLLTGQDRQAIAEFKAALAIAPDRVEILSSLAWALATDSLPEIRDGRQALGLAQRACELSHNSDAPSLDALAAAQARVGQFQLAAQTAHLAADAAARQNLSELSQQIARRISLYEKGEPYTSGH